MELLHLICEGRVCQCWIAAQNFLVVQMEKLVL